ncbi:hypothetical protein Hamer_G002635 [Homarus americanus]|uniref:Uncharacterized protein n=1 Tax=Homarus americanus TaxID=6706 RepID=A0A8J5KFF2_HOMAM|nr:hypothetical protein Hamer_G002635 [Homarus americanus]
MNDARQHNYLTVTQEEQTTCNTLLVQQQPSTSSTMSLPQHTCKITTSATYQGPPSVSGNQHRG